LQEKVVTPTGAEPAFTRLWWGHQVVEEGPTATATHMLPDQNLGLAIIARGKASKAIADDPLNFLVQPQFENGKADWYVTGVWDQENTDDLTVNSDAADSRFRYGSLTTPVATPLTADEFAGFVQATSRRLTQPAQVKLISSGAAPQSAPPDTLQPAK